MTNVIQKGPQTKRERIRFDTWAFIQSLSMLLGTLCGAGFFAMGMMWLELGYGINPWLSFPIALVFFLQSLSYGYTCLQEIDDESRSSIMIDEKE